MNDDHEDEYEEQELLFADGYDEAVIGFARQHTKLFVVYDYKKVMQILERDMDHDDAVDFFEHNMAGAWHGDSTPAYLIKKARDPME